MTSLHTFFFGIYPYTAVGAFLLCQCLRSGGPGQQSCPIPSTAHRDQLHWGRNLFAGGVFFLITGHIAGMLTPPPLYESFGVTTPMKQLIAIIAGTIAGTVSLAGLTLLLYRRLFVAAIRNQCRCLDTIILGWVFMTLLVGMVSIFFSWGHRDGTVMLQLMAWARNLVMLNGQTAASQIIDIPIIYKIHLISGLTIFPLCVIHRIKQEYRRADKEPQPTLLTSLFRT